MALGPTLHLDSDHLGILTTVFPSDKSVKEVTPDSCGRCYTPPERLQGVWTDVPRQSAVGSVRQGSDGAKVRLKHPWTTLSSNLLHFHGLLVTFL